MVVRKQTDKVRRRQRRRLRSKKALFGSSHRYRLVVYRSLKHIYGQIVDDLKGETLVASSSLEKDMDGRLKEAKTKVEKSTVVGVVLAEKAKGKKIKKVVFDRNGFLYHGRVKALAEGARSGGLEF
ncbi:MAG: 50S ribosomal protein L18 [Candidatus Neomarinimicrobiota bacterium]